LLLPLVSDDQRDIGLRKQPFAPWRKTSEGAARLLQLAKDNRLPESLKLPLALNSIMRAGPP